MSGEPKTLTPGELLAIAHEHDWSAHFHDDGYVEIESLGGDALAYEGGLFDALCAATSKVLGVPVVARDEANDDLTTAYLAGFEKGRDAARDEAAELRAALEDARERLRLILTAPEYDLGPEYVGSVALVGVDKADAALRRLAGGESEEEQP